MRLPLTAAAAAAADDDDADSRVARKHVCSAAPRAAWVAASRTYLWPASEMRIF